MSILMKGVDMPKKHYVNGYYIDSDGRVMDISRNNVIGEAIQYVEPERKKGEWVYDPEMFPMGNPDGHYECDQCGEWVHDRTNFCPNCGADMRGEG